MRRDPAPIPQIIAALDQRRYQEAKVLLHGWYLDLTVEPMPDGRVWVISGWFHPETAPLVRALYALPAQPHADEIVIGWDTAWRRRAMLLWDAGAYDDLARRLSGTLRIYAPWNYLYWGRLLARSGRGADAGMFMLLSGIYAPEEAPCVAAYQQRYQRAHPNQVAADLPEPARQRGARAYYPDRVLTDFAAMPSPAWLRRRIPWPKDVLRQADDQITFMC